ncbi:hypothetical protein [Pseudarthrobacter sp. B4EP4b]|uniref:hypothetical protein n=1 Tax=Pseudarthrobacter sp. B4EP4b TaxID=2590664 RepID=UPI0011545C64|nr:hypothetical protein [Pseudarthrobacter sp. B4EP4b]
MHQIEATIEASPRRALSKGSESVNSRRLLGWAVGAILAGLVIWLEKAALLHGWWLLGLTGASLLALPTSRQLSKRIVISGAVFFGGLPLMWWIPRPEWFPGWGHLLLAGALGVLASQVSSSSSPKRALARLVPTVSKADYLILVSAALATAAVAPYFAVTTGQQALALLLTSWDNSSHFNMYNMLRIHGTVIPMAGLSDTGHIWSFIEYPQGFHAAIATMADLAVGSERSTLAKELVAYSRLSSLVAVAAAIMVTAGLTSLPWIRKRPLVSMPFLVFVGTAWSFGTAVPATFFAFHNFLLGVALLVCLMLTTTFEASLAKPTVFLTASTAVVGIAGTWSLLLLLAAPALLLGLFPWVKDRWRTSPAGWLLNVGTALLALAGLILVAWQIGHIGTGDVVTALGKIQSSTHGVEAATLLVTGGSAVLLAGGSFTRFFGGTGAGHAAARLILVPAAGLFLVIGFGVYQVMTSGAVTYYSLKLALAVELLLPVVACVTITSLVDRWLTFHPYVHLRGFTLMSVMVSLGLTQVFGLTIPDTKALGIDPVAPYQKAMTEVGTRTEATAAGADELYRAAENYQAYQGDSIFITGTDELDPLLAAAWYLSLTGTHNQETNELIGGLRYLYNGYSGNLVTSAQDILGANPEVKIVLAPSLRSFLASQGMSDSRLERVLSTN